MAPPTGVGGRTEAQRAAHLASCVRFLQEDPEGFRTVRDLVGSVPDSSQDVLLEGVLETAMSLMNADFGNVQMFDPTSGSLAMVRQDGFSAEFLEYFKKVDDDSSACGRAARICRQTVIDDVCTDSTFALHREIATASGFRAVQSTPLVDYSGKLIGMVSTHFRRPHRPSDRDLRMMAVCGDFFGEALCGKVDRSLSDDPADRISEAAMSALLDVDAVKAMRHSAPIKMAQDDLSVQERIAASLNETVVRRLFALSLEAGGALSLAAQPALQRKLERIISEADLALKELRTAIFDLAVSDHEPENSAS